MVEIPVLTIKTASADSDRRSFCASGAASRYRHERAAGGRGQRQRRHRPDGLLSDPRPLSQRRLSEPQPAELCSRGRRGPGRPGLQCRRPCSTLDAAARRWRMRKPPMIPLWQLTGKPVLAAFQEVEDDLASLRYLARNRNSRPEAVAAARKSLDLELGALQGGNRFLPQRHHDPGDFTGR